MSANGAREPGETRDPEADLAAVQQTALRLLAGVPRPPTALRVQAGPVVLELAWAAPPDGRSLPGPQAAEAILATAPPDGTADGTLDHIHAPTVGVFYRAPEPGAAPFVEEGSVVMPGQQVAIVEAMKLMIPVQADRHCRIVEVLRPDAASVEFGERLFAVTSMDPA
jgi:acetyl-CoA carboxylase biotin carboxyl carrier protein